MTKTCYHCGEDIPKGVNLTTEINQEMQAMCCIGCQSVAQTIVDNNLTDYYRFRSATANKSDNLIPEQLQRNEVFDDQAIQNEFIAQHSVQGSTQAESGLKETILAIDGINCAACAWLIEMQITKLKGITRINVNATTQRATIQWQAQQVKLSDILDAITQLGYSAYPFKASQQEIANKIKSKSFIRRLGISGILMMQVMMIAFGLYFGAFADMAEHNLIYLRWISFILTLPIISYGAFPFYQNAYTSLRVKQLSMDIPVSIAIILAFCASAWATISQQGEVYFESVAMFTFLLLVGKFLEFRARSRAADLSANLLKLMPMTATKLIDNQPSVVAASQLIAEDEILIKPGETIPADSLIISGNSQINEAMISGEQTPVSKKEHAHIYAGTVNGDGVLKAQVLHNNRDSLLSQLINLSENAQTYKPKLALLSDKIAQYFVLLILIATSITAIYWSIQGNSDTFWITLSVLVVTCPCALSLATPTALTCAITRLNRYGIMVKSSHVLETLPSINAMAFDKTGTLTTGEFTLEKVLTFSTNEQTEERQGEAEDQAQYKADVLAIAAALEAHSTHPLAKAFSPYYDARLQVADIEIIASAGITTTINNTHYAIGKPSWLLTDSTTLKNYQDAQCVLLANNILIAVFYLEDQIRNDASQLIKTFKQQQIKTLMLSGDNAYHCQKVQSHLHLDEVFANLTPTDKVEKVKQQQQQYQVAMVGDGVNDTPVLSTAHVSIAMGSGTDIAKNGADVILLSNKLTQISSLFEVAKSTALIIKQNYYWAFGYNALVLPLAMMGFISPYMAVIGMSTSSILVVSNSLRLLKK